MIHSRIKWLHTEGNATTKQKTIRSDNTTSGEDCDDLTKRNRQGKREGCDRSLPKNCVKIVRKGGAVVSRIKERVRRVYEVGCPKVKLEQEEEWYCGKICGEGLNAVA